MLSGFVNAEFTCVQKAAIAVGELHPFRSKHKVRKERGAPFRSSGSERVTKHTMYESYVKDIGVNPLGPPAERNPSQILSIRRNKELEQTTSLLRHTIK